MLKENKRFLNKDLRDLLTLRNDLFATRGFKPCYFQNFQIIVNVFIIVVGVTMTVQCTGALQAAAEEGESHELGPQQQSEAGPFARGKVE